MILPAMTKRPDLYVPGDRFYHHPTGEVEVLQSFAAGNYHNRVGWQLVVLSEYGETVLSYSIACLQDD